MKKEEMRIRKQEGMTFLSFFFTAIEKMSIRKQEGITEREEIEKQEGMTFLSFFTVKSRKRKRRDLAA
jgi:hypothetical protein